MYFKDEVLNTELSVRAKNALINCNIRTLNDLEKNIKKVKEIRNCGKGTFKEILKLLEKEIGRIRFLKTNPYDLKEVTIFGYNLWQIRNIINFAKSKYYEPPNEI